MSHVAAAAGEQVTEQHQQDTELNGLHTNKGPHSYDGLHHLQRLVNGSVCIKISLRHKFVIENCLQLLSQALCLFLKALLLLLDCQ